MAVRAKLGANSRAIAIGLGFGLLVELLALFAAFASAGAGHGDYVAARILFPWSMLLTLIEGRIGAVPLSVGLLQFPVYGGLLGWSIGRGSYFPAKRAGLAHLIAAIICFTGIIPNLS